MLITGGDGTPAARINTMASFIRNRSDVTITCTDAADRAVMIKALVKAGWNGADVSFPGLVLQPTSNKARLLDAVVSAITAAGATVPATAAEWTHRQVVQAGSRLTPNAITTPDGRTLHLTGLGREFTGGEVHGHLWGENVQYAYYA